MADHLVDVVDQNDNIIGQDYKNQKIAKDFISRVVAILLFDEAGKLILCRRSDKKTNAAGLWDLAAFGNVMAGEPYEDAAKRELKEELDIDCHLQLLDKFYQENHNDGMVYKIFCAVFLGRTSQALKLNHELIEIKKVEINELAQDLQSNPANYCPGLINDFNQVKNKL
jgi:isopentenyldiphosphate isomerase